MGNTEYYRGIITPPEWEKPSRILMAFPHEDTDWAYILDEACRQFALIVKAFVNNGLNVILLCKDADKAKSYLEGADLSKIRFVCMEFNDTWTRDYGPIAVRNIDNKKLCYQDFGFNGWGLKFAADKDNLVNMKLAELDIVPKDEYRNHRDFILEGGSIETDGRGTLLSTSLCLCSPNRNGGKTKKELEEILTEHLGFTHYLWLDNGFLEGDDTDSHIDTLARFSVDGKSILYVSPGNDEGPQHESLMKMKSQLQSLTDSEGNPFNLIELPLPDPIYDKDGNRLPATYANYLITDSKIFLPVYNQKAKDREAIKIIASTFPHHVVIPVDCTTLIKQHGSLHCSTMQFY